MKDFFLRIFMVRFKVEVQGVSIPELNETEERDALKTQYTDIFGKAPHHLMKTATIKRRIEERP